VWTFTTPKVVFNVSVRLDPPKEGWRRYSTWKTCVGPASDTGSTDNFCSKSVRCCSNHAIFTFQQCKCALFILHVTVSFRFVLSLDDLDENFSYISEKVNRLHVDILRFSFIKLEYILQIPLKWSVIFLQSWWTSTGYFSNSTGSFVTNCRFSPIIVRFVLSIIRWPEREFLLHFWENEIVNVLEDETFLTCQRWRRREVSAGLSSSERVNL
jgi:hypothetical protein